MELAMTNAALLRSIRAATDVMRRASIDLCLERAMDRLQRLLREPSLERRYNPDWRLQPRVPRGDPDGGQWTRGPGGVGGEDDRSVPSDAMARDGRRPARRLAPTEPPPDEPTGLTDPRVISDANPDNEWVLGEQYAQAPPRGTGGGRSSGGRVTIGRRRFNLNNEEATRLDWSYIQMNVAIARVREIQPTWEPTPQAYETVEGLIASNIAMARQAEARLLELHRRGVVGPAQNPSGSIPARGPGRRLTDAEREIINRLGAELGCHTCGRFNPGTPLGNWVADHQLPNIINRPGMSQRLYPQCATCSQSQGGWLRNHKGDWQ
jgi:hypothetical protein